MFIKAVLISIFLQTRADRQRRLLRGFQLAAPWLLLLLALSLMHATTPSSQPASAGAGGCGAKKLFKILPSVTHQLWPGCQNCVSWKVKCFPPVAGDDAGEVLPQGVGVHIKSPLRKEKELVLTVATILEALKVLPGGFPERAVAPVPRLREPYALHHPITQTSPHSPFSLFTKDHFFFDHL